MPKPFLDFCNIRVVIESIGGRSGTQRVSADLETKGERVAADEFVDAVAGDGAVEFAGAVVIDVILVTELTRWGRSMLDLFHTLQDLQSWDVSLVAQTGLQFDLRSAQGKLIASLMAALAEFERDLLRERFRSGIAAARKRGIVFGRRPGQRVKADRFAPKVLKLGGEGQSYREISHRLGLSKNSVLDIVKRARAAA
jgi:DNA invertase Pin-like site-specific DNA recombinase